MVVMNETIGCGNISNRGYARCASHLCNVVFSAGSFDGLGFEFGKSIGHGSSITIMMSITTITVTILRIGFSLGLGFSLSRTLDNDRAASFADDIFAPLFISNFFTDNIFGDTKLLNTGCASLDLQCVYTMFTGWVNVSHNSMMVSVMVELGVSLGPGQSHGCQHRNQSNLSNHDLFPRTH